MDERIKEIRILAKEHGVDLSNYSDEQLKRKLAIADIRHHMSFFGCDLSHLSDDEVEQRVMSLSQMVAQAGITTQEAMEAAKNFSRIMAER